MTRPIVLLSLALGVGVAAGSSSAQTVAGDRYGAAPTPPPVATAAAYAPPAPRFGRMLTWPGKTPVPAAAASPAAQLQGAASAGAGGVDPRMAWRTTPRANRQLMPTAAPVAQATAALSGAPDQGWRPVFAGRAPTSSPGAQPAPTSIYAAPTPPAVQGAQRLASAAPPPRGVPADRRYGYDPMQAHAVRFYSVHRPFGLSPDPAPIPPQFFTATADLSDPPGPLPVNHVTPSARTAVVSGSDTGGQ